MKEKKVPLIIKNKSLTSLSGNDFGVLVFNDSMKEKYEKGTKVVFIVPDHIDRLSASFIQGLVSEISKIVGRSNLSKYVDIQTSNPLIKEKFEIMVTR